ncbi:PREDICTED: zinc finger protein 2-like [Cyprinodon variegatus]|uniref:zinc finger protein 2-like n=1 Tax=Cyprinodon variegatus TaxID=28743 RepID=UPI000742BA95|nr:PREDICTED: zinc finger protein 2-like [Cyprinodon variegatus]
METTSVYMCFPCYQEFNTLEEVLQHQLTCTVEEDQSSSSGPAPANAPVVQTQQHVINISRAATIQQSDRPESDAPQTEGDSLHSPVHNIKKELEDGAEAERQQTDQPRILYQCGDCDKLFKSLEEWQKHRREGSCEQAALKAALESQVEPEISTADNQAASINTDDASVSNSESSQALKSLEEGIAAEAAEIKAAEASSAQTSDGVAAEVPASDDSSPRRRGVTKKPKPEPVLLCVDCGLCFGLVSELVSHRKTQHGFEEALHRCSVCGESFLNTTLFLYHRKQHRQKGEETVAAAPEVKAAVYTLNNGSNTQDSASSSSSVKPKFTQPEHFFCSQCAQGFKDGISLASHRKEKHSLTAPLHTCSHCGEEFMNTTHFLYHWRQHRSTTMNAAAHEVEISDGSANATSEGGAQSSKKRLSPPAGESGSPLPKRGRPSFRIVSANAQQGNKAAKDDSEGSAAADVNNTNQPPPAKLLQDWARTPLPHVCPYCGKTFTRRVFLRTHVYSHTGEKLFTCKVCTKSFTNSQSLLRHSMNHTGNKPFCCDVCGKSFSQATTLKRHQLIHTSTEPPRKRGRKPACNVDADGFASLFPCPHCPSHFSTEEQLNDHRLLHTSHPFPCPECGEAFKRRKDLDLHSLIHQDKQPVTCPHCASQFINQSVLDIHLQRCPVTEEDRNTGRGRGQGRGRSTGQVECDLCGHRCMTQEGLDLHRLSHTGQTPLKCPVRPCRRRFTSNSALEEHVLAHFQGKLSKSKSRPRFRCEICLKEFAYNSTFSVHMRTHTDERPFEVRGVMEKCVLA